MTTAEATQSRVHDSASLGVQLESVRSLVCRYGLAVGQFLLKDLVLLGASIWTLGEAWSHQGDVAA
jgi:hypothetical protein